MDFPQGCIDIDTGGNAFHLFIVYQLQHQQIQGGQAGQLVSHHSFTLYVHDAHLAVFAQLHSADGKIILHKFQVFAAYPVISVVLESSGALVIFVFQYKGLAPQETDDFRHFHLLRLHQIVVVRNAVSGVSGRRRDVCHAVFQFHVFHYLVLLTNTSRG